MLRVKAPSVKYACLEDLISPCVRVLETYGAQVHAVLLEIWDEQGNAKKWTVYDRMMLGIFCFDEVLSCDLRVNLACTRNKNVIYACLLHREICMRLNEANREYMHSTDEPRREGLLSVLQTVLKNVIMMKASSHMMCLVRENFHRCADANGATWLVCPKHKLREYALAVCMSQDKRLGVASPLHVLPCDLLHVLLKTLFVPTSWDSHPLDSKVKVNVPARGT
jgi:hypothetical protein